MGHFSDWVKPLVSCPFWSVYVQPLCSSQLFLRLSLILRPWQGQISITACDCLFFSVPSFTRSSILNNCHSFKMVPGYCLSHFKRQRDSCSPLTYVMEKLVSPVLSSQPVKAVMRVRLPVWPWGCWLSFGISVLFPVGLLGQGSLSCIQLGLFLLCVALVFHLFSCSSPSLWGSRALILSYAWDRV